MSRKTKCEVWSRVVGYMRPVEAWHEGKQAEFGDRKKFIPNTNVTQDEYEKIKRLDLEKFKPKR